MKLNPFSRSSQKGEGEELAIADSDADDSHIDAVRYKVDRSRSQSSRNSSAMSYGTPSLSFAGGSAAARDKVLKGRNSMASVLGKHNRKAEHGGSHASRSSGPSSSKHSSGSRASALESGSAFDGSRSSSHQSGSRRSSVTDSRESNSNVNNPGMREGRLQSNHFKPVKLKRNPTPDARKIQGAYGDDDEEEHLEMDDYEGGEAVEKPKKRRSSSKKRRHSRSKHRRDKRERRLPDSDSKNAADDGVRDEGEELELVEFKRQNSDIFQELEESEPKSVIAKSDSRSISLSGEEKKLRDETRRSRKSHTSRSRESRKSSHRRRSSSKSRDRKHRERKISSGHKLLDAPRLRERSPSPAADSGSVASSRRSSNNQGRWPASKGLGKLFGFGLTKREEPNASAPKVTDSGIMKIDKYHTKAIKSASTAKRDETAAFRESTTPSTKVVAKRQEDAITPKRDVSYANLYEFDAFPIIDKVPTAIGYHSDDSKDDYASVESGVSRYTVDQKKVRKSKIKHAPDDGSLSDDDKYAQYLGKAPNPALSDSSDSCPNIWNSVDEDDSDWYPEEDEIPQEKQGEKKAAKLKKKKGKRSSKRPMDDDSAGIIDLKTTKPPKKEPKDAIVAARSDDSNDVPGKRKSSRVVIKKEAEEVDDIVLDEETSYEHAGETDPAEALKRHSRKAREWSLEDEVYTSPSLLDKEEPLEISKVSRKRAKARSYEINEDDDDVSSSESDSSSDHENIDRFVQKKMGSKKAKAKTQQRIKSRTKKPRKSLAEKFRLFSKKSRDEDHKVRAHDYDSSSDDSVLDKKVHKKYRNKKSKSSPEEDDLVLTNPNVSDASNDGADDIFAVINNKHHEGRQGLTELDEMDEFSTNGDPNNVSCMTEFPFNFAALALGGPVMAASSLWDMYAQKPEPPQAEEPQDDGVDPTDIVQMQRLKDDEKNPDPSPNKKPKVESILDNLTKSLPTTLPGSSLAKKAKKKLTRQAKEETNNGQKEPKKLNIMDLLRKDVEKIPPPRPPSPPKRPPPEKVRTLKEAPLLSYGANKRSFVADISDWVLSLDDCRAPQPQPSPTKELPFNTIEFPHVDSDRENHRPKEQRRKMQQQNSSRQKNSTTMDGFKGLRGKLHLKDGHSKPQKTRVPIAKSKTTYPKKKGWFGRKY